MFFENIEDEVYYPADNDFSTSSYNQNEYDYDDKSPLLPYKSSELPSIKYINERKCPIYIHDIKKSSSRYNNYNQRLSDTFTGRKGSSPKRSINNSSKFVLDKLEESYWATWKPKKGDINAHIKEKSATTNSHSGKSKNVTIVHGDTNTTKTKFLTINHPVTPAKDSPSTTTVPTTTDIQEPTNHRKTLRKLFKPESIMKVDEPPDQSDATETVDNPLKRPSRSKRPPKIKPKEEEKPVEADSSNDNEEIVSNIKHKDSLIITKEKQGKAETKHFQQPKCIRLYRKSATVGHVKGGSYPLRSCLKKEPHPKGNFRLGAPGSPLFIAPGSSLNKKHK
ncbi:hypothetical protein GWI33_000252 [Rhynchophorus ferrugineus]|uniref:Uncharacterized protein n=1 Tax=Rhynchophorus ferrugineus TaxID=354439 RepID=A0A834J0G9_RHYFE|nr:hypothetical protein GWI33_000252 [Rhynchophorus ferrugineus]